MRKKITLEGLISNIGKSINENRMFAATCMLMLNIGSRYVNLGITKSQEHYIRKLLKPEIFVFIVFWMGSRDIYYAFILASVYSLLARFLFNENSQLCIVKNKFAKVMDTNNDGKISNDELERASGILRQATKSTEKKDTQYAQYTQGATKPFNNTRYNIT